MGMLDELIAREDTGSIIIDADSLLFASCYQFREDYNIELAYMNFMERIGTIRTACYDKVSKLNDLKIAFTSKTNFRYNIYSDYKASRASKTNEQELLVQNTKELKKLIYDRVKPIVLVSSTFEADDICVRYAYKGYMVAAIDKDIVNAIPTISFNYKKAEWNNAKTDEEIKEWYIYQSLTGDSTDGIKGAKKIGKVGATKFIKELKAGTKNYNDYINLYETPQDCLLTNQLVRMNQWDSKGKLKLITMEEVIKEIQYYDPYKDEEW